MKSNNLVFTAPLLVALLMLVCGDMEVAFPFIFLALIVGFTAWTYLVFHALYKAYQCGKEEPQGVPFYEQEETGQASFKRELSTANTWILKEFLTSCIMMGIYYYLSKSLMYHLRASYIIGGLAILSVILFIVKLMEPDSDNTIQATPYNCSRQTRPIIFSFALAISVSFLTWITITNISLIVANKTYYKSEVSYSNCIMDKRESLISRELKIRTNEESTNWKKISDLEIPTLAQPLLDLLPDISGYRYFGGYKDKYNDYLWIKVSNSEYEMYELDPYNTLVELIVKEGYYGISVYEKYNLLGTLTEDDDTITSDIEAK